MLMEEWVEVPDFPWYSISNYGRVRGGEKDRILKWSPIQYNIPTVGLVKDGKPYRRSVPVLVARAFIPVPHVADPSYPAFDTPIHLDGDRSNPRVDNLEWRPRWFAVNYHKERGFKPFPQWNRDIRLIQTGEVFSSPREAAQKYGELENDIYKSVMHYGEKSVFPHGHRYVFDHPL